MSYLIPYSLSLSNFICIVHLPCHAQLFVTLHNFTKSNPAFPCPTWRQVKSLIPAIRIYTRVIDSIHDLHELKKPGRVRERGLRPMLQRIHAICTDITKPTFCTISSLPLRSLHTIPAPVHATFPYLELIEFDTYAKKTFIVRMLDD